VAETLLPVSADYTDKDFDSARRRLFALIASVFPTWTDASVANFGNILVEMFAWCMDVTGFYQDNQALESRITTAVQRKNLLALAKLVNYEPATAEAAQCLVKFTCSPAPPVGDNVVLGGVKNPFPIVVKTGDGVAKFELQNTVTLTSVAPSAWGTVENSETHVENFTADGNLGQEITLGRTPYLDGSALVVAGNGGYIEVASFLNSIATDRHFTLAANNVDMATIRFPNMVTGQIPSGAIFVTYKTGGGSVGNVDPNAIDTIEGSFQTNSGLPVTITVVNDGEKATGGDDRESEAAIRENAPLSLRVLTRAVCRDDFEILSVKVGGMARALMLTNTESGDIPINTGHLYLLPETGSDRTVSPGFPTPAKMDEVYRRIRSDYPWPTSFTVIPRVPTFLDISVYALVYLRKGYSTADVAAQAKAAYQDYFALRNADGTTNTRINFGFYYETDAADSAKVVPLSDLQNVLRDCPGIQRLGVAQSDFVVAASTDNTSGTYAIRVTAGSHTNIPILAFEFPRFVAVVLVDGATGAVL
jgi:hypothetical protein